MGKSASGPLSRGRACGLRVGTSHGQGQQGGVEGCMATFIFILRSQHDVFLVFPTEKRHQGAIWLVGTGQKICLRVKMSICLREDGGRSASACSSGELFGLAMGCRWVDSTVPTAFSWCRQLQQLARGGAAAPPPSPPSSPPLCPPILQACAPTTAHTVKDALASSSEFLVQNPFRSQLTTQLNIALTAARVSNTNAL